MVEVEAGGIGGRSIVMDHGDPSAEYRLVRDGAGVAERDDLAVIELTGRDPVRMVQGLITGDLAAAGSDRAVYGAMLTPKGRVIAELRALRTPAGDGERVLLIVPREGLDAAGAHLKRSVPPLYARWRDASDEVVVVGVYGPRAGDALATALEAEALPLLEEDRATIVPGAEGETIVIGTRYAGGEPGYDLLVSREESAALRDRLLQVEGVGPIGFTALETLRIEGGVPRGGRELTEAVIPTEAFEAIGMMERAISFQKGCYTGQEVIVRIAHRGHVNRHLRGLRLDPAVPLPEVGSRLFDPGRERDIGWITSVTVSPQIGGPVALAFVRREMEPGAEVRVGAADGAAATVAELPFAGGR